MRAMRPIWSLLLLVMSPVLLAAANPLASLDALGAMPQRPTHADCEKLVGAKQAATALRDASMAETSGRASGPMDAATLANILTPTQEMAMETSSITMHQALLATVVTADAKAAQKLRETLQAIAARKCSNGDKSCEAAKKAATKAAYSQAATQYMAEVTAPYQAAEQQARVWIPPREARLDGMLNLLPPALLASTLAGVRGSDWQPVISLIDRRAQICNTASTWLDIAESPE